MHLRAESAGSAHAPLARRVQPLRPPGSVRLFTSSRRSLRSHLPQAAAGGDAGSIGGGRNDDWGKGGGCGGGSGGSGGDGGAGDGSNEQPKRPGFGWQGWRDRVAYDPEFPFKVLLEQVIGVGAAVIGDMSSRPNWGLNELDFVFATLVVGSIMNFSIMYLLAPTAGSTASGSLLANIMSGQILSTLGAPAGNMFEPGFPLHTRLINFLGKGIILGGLGFTAGVVGTAISNGLLSLRKRLDPEFTTQNEAPSVLGNAVCWGAHMAFSSNLRYQVLGGVDQLLVKVMPISLFRGYQAVIRLLNNILGGMTFVVIARLFGVQRAPEVA